MDIVVRRVLWILLAVMRPIVYGVSSVAALLGALTCIIWKVSPAGARFPFFEGLAISASVLFIPAVYEIIMISVEGGQDAVRPRN